MCRSAFPAAAASDRRLLATAFQARCRRPPADRAADLLPDVDQAGRHRGVVVAHFVQPDRFIGTNSTPPSRPAAVGTGDRASDPSIFMALFVIGACHRLLTEVVPGRSGRRNRGIEPVYWSAIQLPW